MQTFSDERLAERQGGIGGSDAAAAVGMSPWKTPYALFLEKTGQAEPEESTEIMRLGTRLEDVIADEYMERTGRKLHRVNQLLRHKAHPWMLASLDRRIVGEPAVVECKAVNAFAYRSEEWGPEGTDEIPTSYLIQCHHYLAVTGYERAELAALVGGSTLKIYVVPRSEEFIATLIEREAAFWAHVERKEPPPVSSVDEAKARWPVSSGVSIEATPEVAAACARLKELKAKAKDLEADVDDVDTIVRGFMGDADTLVLGEKTLATWKSAKPSDRFDAKRFEAENPDLYRAYVSPVPGARRMLLK